MDRKIAMMAEVAMNLVEEVTLSEIKYDTSYQRGLKPHHKKIGKNFDRDAMGTPVLGQRNTAELWCIDGMQRIAGAQIAGIKTWPCLIIPSTGNEFEAALFAKINRDRKGVSQVEQFKAALTQKDPVAIGAKRVVEMLGYHIPLHSGGSSDSGAKYIVCHGTLYKMCKAYGEANLYRTIALMIATWPEDTMALSSICLSGLGQLLHEHGDKIDDERFARLLGVRTIGQVVSFAKLDLMGSLSVKFKRALVRLYNKRLAKKNKIVLRDSEEEIDD